MRYALPLVLALAIMATGCTRKTVIYSTPPGAEAPAADSSQGYEYSSGPAPEERPLDDGWPGPGAFAEDSGDQGALEGSPPGMTPSPGERRPYDNTPYWEQGPGASQAQYFALQVGSFSSPDNAQAFSRTLQASGFETSIETVTVNGATQHRVVAVAQGQEQELRDRLTTLGVYDPIVLYKSSVPPGQYPSTPGSASPSSARDSFFPPRPANAAGPNPPPGAQENPDEYLTLEETPEPSGTYTYQVGSFTLDANAQSLARALESRGFQTRVDQGRDDRGTVYTVSATAVGSENDVLSRLEQAGIYDPIMLHARSPQQTPEISAPATPAGGAAASSQEFGAMVYQVGVFTSRANADELRNKLAAAGFDARIETVSMGGATHYKVLAGRSGNDAEIRALLRQNGIVDPIVRSH